MKLQENEATTENHPEHSPLLQFCFNPLCNDNFNRIFKPSDSHHDIPKCKRWIFSQSFLEKIKSQNLHDYQQHYQEKLQLYSFPLKQIMLSKMKKMHSIANLTQIFKSLKNDLEETLKICEKSVMMRLQKQYESIQNLSESFAQVISNEENSENMMAYSIENVLFKNYERINQFKDVSIYNMKTIYEDQLEIRRSIEKMCEKLVQDVGIQGGCENITQDDIKRMNDFVLVTNGAIKLKALTKFLGWEDKQIAVEFKKHCRVICQYCQHQQKQSLSAFKNIIAPTNFLTHLLNSHQLEMTTCFALNTSNKFIYQLTLDDLFYTLNSEKYNEILILDGLSGMYQRESYKPGVFILELISENRPTNQIKNKFILLKNHDQLFYYYSIIAYQASKKMKKKITIRSHNLAKYNSFTKFIEFLMPNVQVVNQNAKKQNLKHDKKQND